MDSTFFLNISSDLQDKINQTQGNKMSDLSYSKKKKLPVLTEEALEEIFNRFDSPDSGSPTGSTFRDYISGYLDEIIDETNIRDFIQENIGRAQSYITKLEHHQLIAPEDIALKPALHTISGQIKNNLYKEKWFDQQRNVYWHTIVEKPFKVHYHHFICFLVRILQAENCCELGNIERAKESLKEGINNYRMAKGEINRVLYMRAEQAEEERQKELREQELKRQDEIRQEQKQLRKKQERERKARKGGNARAEKFLPIKQEIIRIIENPPSGNWPDKAQLKDNIIFGVEAFLASTGSSLLKPSNLDETIAKWLSTDETIKAACERNLLKIASKPPKNPKQVKF